MSGVLHEFGQSIGIDTPFELALAGAAPATLAALGTLALTPVISHGSLSESDRPAEKGKNTRIAEKLRRLFEQQFQSTPTVERSRKHHPLQSHFDPDANQVLTSYLAAPALLAHEHGHAATKQQRAKNILGRAVEGATYLAYSPVPALTSVGASLALTGGLPEVGAGLTAAAAGLGIAQMIEEYRASRKALDVLKKIRGKTEARDVLPLAAALATYGAANIANVGGPALVAALA